MLPFWPAVVTLLIVLLLFATAWGGGSARGRYGIKAPATSGHPAFERMFRVQMNTQEAALMTLPALWIAAWYGNPDYAAIAGAVWITARVWYAVAYSRDADKRGPAFTLGALALVALIVIAASGLLRAAGL